MLSNDGSMNTNEDIIDKNNIVLSNGGSMTFDNIYSNQLSAMDLEYVLLICI